MLFQIMKRKCALAGKAPNMNLTSKWQFNLAVTLATLVGTPYLNAQSPAKPNILVIMGDTTPM
jgi:hypothetical protein